MKRGFYTIMTAQFFSSLADNALFVAAIELLRSQGEPKWQAAALVPLFALFYVLLAPFVGAFADAKPKGQVMFISNAIKVVGCLLMLVGVHPLLAYTLVGLGAAAYSPAKYGILTELLPPSQLVKANGWIEGLTIASIILGVLLGGQLVSPWVSGALLSIDLPGLNTGIDHPAEAAIAALVVLYALAAWFNTRIPLSGVTPARCPKTRWPCCPISGAATCACGATTSADLLSTTTLFWGVSGNLRYIVLAWAGVALGYSTTQASSLVGVVALGTAVGAVVASMRMKLDQATRVMPLGIAMGVLVIGMNFIHNVWVAAPFLVLLGGLGGFLVVPMNALLQHRGHNLMGAGRSIAVQNFNEQACILFLGAAYSASTAAGVTSMVAITAFGVVVGGFMWAIMKWHQYNLRTHPHELERLLEIARRDDLHG
ncbi:MAG: lysophospholipid transporter LplT [Burkholderiaceae bacterium]